MSQAIQWIKSNVVIVVCLLVMLIAMLSLLWPTAGAGAALRDQIAEREKAKGKAQTLLSQRVRIPSPNPGEPPQSVNITVNDAAVAELKRIFGDMNDGYQALEAAVVAFNQQGPASTNPHVPMLDGLLPRPTFDNKVFDARSAYKSQFVKLYQSLNAGLPPTDAEVQVLFDRVTAAFAANEIGGVTDLKNNAELNQQLARKQLELYINRASQISIYCPPTRLVGDQLEPGVFDIDQWAQRTDRPTMAEIWQGQMNYWIQQDLIAAVRVANFNEQNTSVRRSPIKRLIGIEVVPGYIGLVERGSTLSDRPRRSRNDDSTLPEPVPADDLNQPLKRDFRVSLTGRRTNSLYDVRHARMSLIVDARQVPRLLNAFGQVNLMTPMIQRITAVDQVAHLREGYVYGDGVDVVQVDLLIESLWLREWTAGHLSPEAAEQAGEGFNPGLMPDSVRYRLSLPTRDPDYTPAQDAEEGSDPGGRFIPGPEGEFIPGPEGEFIPGSEGQRL